MQEESV